MNNSVLTSLISPAIALTLAVPFVVLWLYRGERFYLLMIAAGFFGSALGFVLQCFILPIGLPATKVLSNFSFMLASLAIASSVISRYGVPVPWIRLGVLATAGLGAFSWFMFVQPDLTARVLSMNFALGGITLLIAAELRKLPARGPIEFVLVVLAGLSALNFIFRPLVLAALDGSFDRNENFYASLYWVTALLSHAVLSLFIALTLLTAEALDIIRSLRSETFTDPLSGLLNRRGFDARAIVKLAECRTKGVPASLVIIDLDRFKALNDAFGHATGDNVIIAFAALLRAAAGTDAVCGRIGGEEFAVLLPLSDAMGARMFSEGVRTSLSLSPMKGLPPDVRVTGSFGVATDIGQETLGDLARRADKALYLAKRSGRNTVRISSESENFPAVYTAA